MQIRVCYNVLHCYLATSCNYIEDIILSPYMNSEVEKVSLHSINNDYPQLLKIRFPDTRANQENESIDLEE
jgi:hypothetical protein